MGALVIRVSGRGMRSADVYKVDAQTVRIGRAFDNDLILSDVFVAPHEIEIRRDGTRLDLALVEPANAVSVDGEAVTDPLTTIQPGSELTVGRTRLQVFGDDQPVEPARTFGLAGRFRYDHVPLWIAGVALVLVSVVGAAAEYAFSSVDLEFTNYAYLGLFSAAVLIVWAGIWALVGRLIRHHAHFSAQLLGTIIVSVISTLLFLIPTYAEFVTSSHHVGEYAGYLLAFASFTLLIVVNLRIATNIRRTGLTAAVVSFVLVGLAFAGTKWAQNHFQYEPMYSSVVQPPFARVGRPAGLDAFLRHASEIDIEIE